MIKDLSSLGNDSSLPPRGKLSKNNFVTTLLNSLKNIYKRFIYKARSQYYTDWADAAT